MKDDHPRKIPLVFFRTLAGGEPVREWLKGLPEAERHIIGKDLLRAQWEVASRDAALQTIGKRLVGDPYGLTDKTDGARAAVPVRRPSGSVARIYQENAQNSG